MGHVECTPFAEAIHALNDIKNNASVTIKRGGCILYYLAGNDWGQVFMLYYVLKILISAVVIVAITEIAKRNTGFAALIAALPLTSLLAFVWLYLDGSSLSEIADLSVQIFWLVLPSLTLFLLFPVLLQQGMGFWPSLGLSAVATIISYFIFIFLLRHNGMQF